MATLARIGVALAVAARADRSQPPDHHADPPFLQLLTERQLAALADGGMTVERDCDPADELAEQHRFDRAPAALQPERPGTVAAHVVVAALDSDSVFGREARAAAQVFARRYDAAGRMISLTGSDGAAPSTVPMGSLRAIEAALARVVELMDRQEDVLVLYTTSHGAPWGIVYDDGDQGFGAIPFARLHDVLTWLGIGNRLTMVSACYEGVSLPALRSRTNAIATAAAADRGSFGCQTDGAWTFLGNALVNDALRKPQPFASAAIEAQATIGSREKRCRLTPSRLRSQSGPMWRGGLLRWRLASHRRPAHRRAGRRLPGWRG